MASEALRAVAEPLIRESILRWVKKGALVEPRLMVRCLVQLIRQTIPHVHGRMPRDAAMALDGVDRWVSGEEGGGRLWNLCERARDSTGGVGRGLPAPAARSRVAFASHLAALVGDRCDRWASYGHSTSHSSQAIDAAEALLGELEGVHASMLWGASGFRGRALRTFESERWPITADPSPELLHLADEQYQVAWDMVAGNTRGGAMTIPELLEAHRRAAAVRLLWGVPLQRAIAERAESSEQIGEILGV